MKILTAAFLCLTLIFNVLIFAQNPQSGTVTILYSPNHPANTFIPMQTLGAGIDGHEKGEVNHILRPQNIRQMLSAGFQPLTYRLRTELGDEAWHWNPSGTWSDPARHQGYWISDSAAAKPIMLSYGYKLPRRGNTIDQANDDGYSRLDDGDSATFWKSNPYLDPHYTNDPESEHPQWITVDFGKEIDINAIRIAWGKPFAVDYKIEYGGDIGAKYFNADKPNFWTLFLNGVITGNTSDDRLIKLSDKPIKARFIRVLMTKSSHSAPENQNDIRNRLGYAIREIYAGLIDVNGNFNDLIKHSPTHLGQTTIYVSSTDSWHRAQDLDNLVEQPGIDRIYQTGLTNKLPVLFPVGVVYDSPENAVALVRYLNAKHYPVAGIEMGEEPDQISGTDYGALYSTWAQALRRIAPGLRLGGPSLATITPSGENLDDFDEKYWLNHFINYLRSRRQLNTLNFFSFEWYPYDDVCQPTAPQLAGASRLLARAFTGVREAVPPDIPIWITEYGYSAFAGEAEVKIEGALLNADIVGQFLTLGGDRSYLYGYEPNDIIQEFPCSWGNNMLFVKDDEGLIKFPTAIYYGARMLTRSWAQPANVKLEIFPAAADILNESQEPLVTSYAIHRPDDKWSLMLINKDPRKDWKVQIKILNQDSGKTSYLKFPVKVEQFSKAQYQWQAAGKNGHPVRNFPPSQKIVSGKGSHILSLPPYSLTVIKEI